MFFNTLVLISLPAVNAVYWMPVGDRSDFNTTYPQSTYSEAAALMRLQYAGASYCNPQQIEDWTCKPCMRNDAPALTEAQVIEDRKISGIQAFVGTNVNQDIVIAFRGSENIQNWMENLKVVKTKWVDEAGACNSCHVMDGFLDTWNAVKDEVLSLVDSRLQTLSSPNIYITGHSLGASVAILCAAELQFNKKLPVSDVFTFGEPRTGDRNFENFLRTGLTVYRVTHWKDPVPHLPLEWMGFHHEPVEVFYNEDSTKFTICNGSGEDINCSNQFNVPSAVSDHLHYLKHYISINAC